jgi:hypothetical protein
MQTLMTDFYTAKMVQGAKGGMHLLILRGYRDSTVVVECSDACLQNIYAVVGAHIDNIREVEAAEIQLEEDKAAWIKKHSIKEANHEAV